MATIACTVQRSAWYSVYVEYSYTQDSVNSKTTLTHALKLKQLTDSYDFDTVSSVTVGYYINGSYFSTTGRINIDDVGNTGYTITLASGITTVSHNTSTGAGAFTVSVNTVINGGGYGPGTITLSEQTVSLPTIDRTAPTVLFTTSNITTSSVYINATASSPCDIWQYSINNGNSWIQFSTSTSTSAAKTITGLSPNTTYTICIRARKASNQVYGTSLGKSISTLGGSILNSVSVLAIDSDSPVISFNWTVYNSDYTHQLEIRYGNTTVLTISNLLGSAGTNNKTYTLTDSQRTTILNAMTATKAFTATYILRTYNVTTQIGSGSTTTATIQTSSDRSAPIFTAFTYKDNNSQTVIVTGNNQIFIQGYSDLLVTCSAATGQNGASISHYTATIGAISVRSANISISFGTVSVSGNLTLTVTATDSRGYTSSVSTAITVISYTPISIDAWTIRRINEVEENVQLSFNGKISAVVVDGTVKNALVKVAYQYKITTETDWSDAIPIDSVNVTNVSFAYNGILPTAFAAVNAFYVRITANDALTSSNIELLLNKGTPLVAFRSQKVGINNADPQAALDVNGNVLVSGSLAANCVTGAINPFGNADLIASTSLNTLSDGWSTYSGGCQYTVTDISSKYRQLMVLFSGVRASTECGIVSDIVVTGSDATVSDALTIDLSASGHYICGFQMIDLISPLKRKIKGGYSGSHIAGYYGSVTSEQWHFVDWGTITSIIVRIRPSASGSSFNVGNIYTYGCY